MPADTTWGFYQTALRHMENPPEVLHHEAKKCWSRMALLYPNTLQNTAYPSWTSTAAMIAIKGLNIAECSLLGGVTCLLLSAI